MERLIKILEVGNVWVDKQKKWLQECVISAKIQKEML